MTAAVLSMQSPQATTSSTRAADAGIDWSNRFASLGREFFSELGAEPLPDPHWVATSFDCAELLGLPHDWLRRPDLEALRVFSGNARWRGMRPLASVYSGHQFGVWAGQLGDGRALWLGEVESASGPLEIQLKGSGRTPYSRLGDGRAVLRSSIREFLCSEAMAALGVPTTRALCVTGSALPVQREQIETAAVVTRVAPSFIRFGHFEHFAHHDQAAALRRLADFLIEHHFAECRSAPQPYTALLEAVTRRTARLLADWQSVGFCHGVMNTDNMSMLGLTIDYGPYGFLDAFDPGHVCNHSDHQGRYAFAHQPSVALWNLHALAQAMLPLIGDPDKALAALEPYKAEFSQALVERLSAKLGLIGKERGDPALIDRLLTLMAKDRCDFAIVFRRLSSFDSSPGAVNSELRELFIDREAFDAWAQQYGSRLRLEGSVDAQRAVRMNRINAKFTLRNHLAEIAIGQACQGEFSEVERLHRILRRPFDEQEENARYAGLPPDRGRGAMSCSS